MRDTVLTLFATVVGALIGSFLNACIHRLPRDISINNPKRSFCPSCQKQIPWYENLPIVSWLVLRGRCSNCGAKISVRYLVVEAITAGFFYLAWTSFGLPLGPIYCVLLSLLIVATFIDFEHFIIPDEITWGGAAAGIVFSLLVPDLMGTSSRWESLGLSVLGAVCGYGILWIILELGKLAFGRVRHTFEEPQPFSLCPAEDSFALTIGEETLAWHDIFAREKDQLVLQCTEATLNGEVLPSSTLRFHHNRLLIEGKETPIEEIKELSGQIKEAVIPREAMGAGDLKFMACIGAFLGWKAILFTLMASSFIGCAAALAGMFIARDRSGARLPFGPFLAGGAVLWIFWGHALLAWYLALLNGGEGILEF